MSLDLQCDCMVYFSLYNAGTSIQVSLQSSTADSGGSSSERSMDSSLPLIVGIVGFFAMAMLGVAVGCVIFMWRRRVMRRVEVQNEFNVEGIAQEKVESMFPQRRFSQLSSFLLSDTCSVCLDRFKSSSDVRVLPCKHIYHSACIDLWFLNNHVISL